MKKCLYKTIDKVTRLTHNNENTRLRRKGMVIKMKKTLYSLMLSDDVVQAVDAMAHRMGMSRSGLVNQILADRVSVSTPERRISDIFQAIEELVAPGQELVPFFAPGSPVLSLKSSLSYKYRPTVRYAVELDGADGDTLGELSVVFRTQSAELIAALTEFFRLWVRIENAHLAPLLGVEPECALYDGKFVRAIALPRSGRCTAEDLAGAISDYVQLLDRTLKGCLSGELTPRDAERLYCEDLAGRRLLI